MKKAITLILSLIALIAIAIFVTDPVSLFTKHHQPWSFIQSAGGMKVDINGDRLIVRCDVSGLKTITTKPSTIHSGIGVHETKCSLLGNTLQISVVTSVIKKGMSTECDSLDISDYPAGEYTLAYLNQDGTTHEMGTIAVP